MLIRLKKHRRILAAVVRDFTGCRTGCVLIKEKRQVNSIPIKKTTEKQGE
jgi:hypothetical protein